MSCGGWSKDQQGFFLTTRTGFKGLIPSGNLYTEFASHLHLLMNLSESQGSHSALNLSLVEPLVALTTVQVHSKTRGDHCGHIACR